MVAPTEGAVFAGMVADTQAAFGGDLTYTTQAGAPVNATPQAQLASSQTAIIGDSFAMFVLFCNLVDPAYSFGRMQDAIGRIYFIARIAGAPTVQSCACVGLADVVIPLGSIARDPDTGLLWISQAPGTIPVGGSVSVDFACVDNGPIPGPATLTISSTVFGWNSVTPTGDPALGRNVESASQFEARRSASTGLNSMGPLNAIYAAVADLPDILDVYTVQNNTGSPATIGGVSVGAHSIYVAALGATDDAVAYAIFSRKGPCGMTGDTTVSVADPNPAYYPSPPIYDITFQRPDIIPFAVIVTITNSVAVPSNALTLIQPAIIAGFAGADGGSRAKIGAIVYASRYYGDVAGVSSTFNGTTGQVIPGWSSSIVSILVGRSGVASQFTGAISGNTLTTSATTGVIAIGQLVQSAHVRGGTVITAGSGTTWTVSGDVQTVVSEAMTGTTMASDVALDIDEAPGVTAANIYLVLV